MMYLMIQLQVDVFSLSVVQKHLLKQKSYLPPPKKKKKLLKQKNVQGILWKGRRNRSWGGPETHADYVRIPDWWGVLLPSSPPPARDYLS